MDYDISDLELENINELASSGDPTAQTYLGWAHGKNGSLKYDPVISEKWLRLAAKSGSLNGKRQLARFLYDHNRNETIEVARDLIDERDFYGHYLLGMIKAKGACGSPADKTTAIQSFERAANMGHLLSERELLKLKYGIPVLNPASFVGAIKVVIKIAKLRIFDRDNIALYE